MRGYPRVDDSAVLFDDMDPRLVHSFGWLETLSEEQDIRVDFGGCLFAESAIGESDARDQLGALCQVTAYTLASFVENETLCDDGDNAARSNCVEAPMKEVIVNGERPYPLEWYLDLA